MKRNNYRDTIDSALKQIPNSLRKKVEAKKHNEFYTPLSLDDKEWSWNKSCRKCHGRGYTSIEVLTGKPLLCKCCYKVEE